MQIKDVWERKGIERADAEILLGALLGKDRTWILGHAHDEIPDEHQSRLTTWLERRRHGEPVAYITGIREFYGREFHVDPRVLIPRPSTEGLIDAALEFLVHHDHTETLKNIESGIAVYGERWRRDRIGCVADIGTGSGCIAVTLVCERPGLRIIATDIDADALNVARLHAERFSAANRIDFRRGPLLEPLRDVREPFFIVSNPPYVPEHYDVSPEVSREPQSAVFAGPRGLDLLLPLVRQAREHPACVGFVVECRENQVEFLAARRP